MTAYQRGDYREKRAKEALEDCGYIVWQTRGSHGFADLIAERRDGKTLLVQVKTGKAQLAHWEWNGLYRLAESIDAIAVVVTMQEKRMQWRRIEGVHVTYTQTWPASLITSLSDIR